MKNKKILIVDDNALNRQVFENIISYHYPYATANNGKEALEKLSQEGFDLILMDIQMPMLDGISALKKIKNDNLSQAPVIAISAYSNQEDKNYFLSVGFDDFMAKPVKPKTLLEAIHFHLLKREAHFEQKDTLEDEILDQKVYFQLLKFNSKENIHEVYQDFLEEAEGLIAEIGESIEKQNYEDIGEKLHILKGNSGTLGATQLFKFVTFFEKKIKNVHLEDILENNLVLKQHLNNFKAHLNTLQIITTHE
ncbi:response regulator [Pararhodonellum marinum]|uniref:response regulator n=1 Tax=Pararhodonellum marinum TaxID=2755358 RepID=UPI00188F9F8D|nr:response regulator [Pararhodonellum marinum]